VTASRRPSLPAILLALTPLAPLSGLLPGGRWLLPLAAPITLWQVFAPAVRAGRYGKALGAGLIWAALLSAGVIVFTVSAPHLAGRAIVNGEAYRTEMFGWVETAVAPENDPRQFVPQHMLHLTGFAVLTLASGGYLGLALGAFLVDYMSYFVGSFAASSGRVLFGSLVAWVPWSVVRVISFVALGAILASPLLARRRWGEREWRWIACALFGILLDLTIKTLLAPSYGLFLRSLLSQS